MDRYEYEVKLKVRVEAFDESDAWDAIQDAFGVGENGGIEITQCDYSEKAKKRK